MHILKILSTSVICLTLSGCVTSEYAAGMAVSKPETIIYNSSVPKVRAALAQACDQSQLFVEQQSDNMVVCSQEAGSMANFVFGSTYGTPVQSKVQFNIFENADGGIKVSGRGWYEDQNAYGRIDKQYLDQGVPVQQIQGVLNAVKAKLEGGKK